jgi:hypothetical protein
MLYTVFMCILQQPALNINIMFASYIRVSVLNININFFVNFIFEPTLFVVNCHSRVLPFYYRSTLCIFSLPVYPPPGFPTVYQNAESLYFLLIAIRISSKTVPVSLFTQEDRDVGSTYSLSCVINFFMIRFPPLRYAT